MRNHLPYKFHHCSKFDDFYTTLSLQNQKKKAHSHENFFRLDFCKQNEYAVLPTKQKVCINGAILAKSNKRTKLFYTATMNMYTKQNIKIIQ